MNHHLIIQELDRNRQVFEGLTRGLPAEMYLWKPAPEKWCLLEVACHLCDEEVEDFRARVRHVLEQPEAPMPPIDPVGWVTARDYLGQDFGKTVDRWQEARRESISWLQSLKAPRWENIHHHPKIGPRSANLYLANWLAHDYLHIRQIVRIKHQYLAAQSGQNLDYAGPWS